MTDGHGQAEAIADLNLESFLPGSSLIAIAAASVGQQQKVIGSWEAHLAFGPPPGADGIDGEGRCVARRADADESTIARQVIDAIRHGAAERIVRIVMHVYGGWFASPSLAGVLEVAHEFAG